MNLEVIWQDYNIFEFDTTLYEMTTCVNSKITIIYPIWQEYLVLIF